MPIEKIKDETETINCLGAPHNVILFNDNVHSFDEVMSQVVSAIGCTHSRAGDLVMEAHASGRAIVFTGNLETCELKDSLLGASPTNLRTAIEPV